MAEGEDDDAAVAEHDDDDADDADEEVEIGHGWTRDDWGIRAAGTAMVFLHLSNKFRREGEPVCKSSAKKKKSHPSALRRRANGCGEVPC